MDAQVQIMQVTVRNTKTGKTVYDVACSDGVKRQIWDGSLATVANSYAGTGQVVTIRYDVTQNGKYTNHSIQAVAGPGQQLPPDTNMLPAPMGAAPMPGVLQQQPPTMGGNTQPIQAAPQGGGSSSGGSRWTPETTTRITKLAAYEYASHVVGGLFAGAGPEAEAEAIAMLDRIAKHVYAASRSHEQQPAQQAPIVPTAATPEQVAAIVPGVQVGAPVAAQQDATAEAPDVIEWD